MLGVILRALFPWLHARRRNCIAADHSRRWEGVISPERLRRALAKLSPEVAKALLSDIALMKQNLLTEGALLDAMCLRSISQEEAESIISRYGEGTLMVHVFAFFSHVLVSSEPARTPPLLPRHLLYHEVHLPLPVAFETLDEASGAGDAEQLMPVAKAYKLPHAQKPKQARGAKNKNHRRLYLCEACESYKQAVEFYVCCLHDTNRCCRQCMLKRPAEPFGEHLVEEQRTEPVLKLIDAAIDALSERMLSHERAAILEHRQKPAGQVSAPSSAQASPPSSAQETAAADDAQSAVGAVPSAVPSAATAPTVDSPSAAAAHSYASAGTGAEGASAPQEAYSSCAHGCGYAGEAAAEAAPGVPSSSRDETLHSAESRAAESRAHLLVDAARRALPPLQHGARLTLSVCFQLLRWLWLLVFRASLLLVSLVRSAAETTAGAAALVVACVVAFGWWSLRVLPTGGVWVALSWLVAAVLLPLGASQLYHLFPHVVEAVAGDMERWAFQFASVRSMEQAREVVAQASEEVRRRARKARKHAAAAMKGLEGAEEDAREGGARPAAAEGAETAVRHHADTECEEAVRAREVYPRTNFPASPRVAMGVVGAVLLPSVMLFGAGGTLVLGLWLVAAVLLPMGAGQLYSLCPKWTEAIAGDMERWAFQFASVRSIEQAREVVEQAREEVSRRARRARKHAAAAIQALDAQHADETDNHADETDNGADDSHEAKHEAQPSVTAAPDAPHASRSPEAARDNASTAVALTTAGTTARDAASVERECAPSQPRAGHREHHHHQQHHSHRQHHQCHHGQHHRADTRPSEYFAPKTSNASTSASALPFADSAAAASASLAAPSTTTGLRCVEDGSQPLDARLLPDGSVQLSTSIGAWRLSASRRRSEGGGECWGEAQTDRACSDAPAIASRADSGSAAAAIAAALSGAEATLAASDARLTQLPGDDARVTSFVRLLSESPARASVPTPRETQLVDQMEQIIQAVQRLESKVDALEHEQRRQHEDARRMQTALGSMEKSAKGRHASSPTRIPAGAAQTAAAATSKRTERLSGDAAFSGSEAADRAAKRATSTNASGGASTRAVSKEQHSAAALASATSDSKSNASSEAQQRPHLNPPTDCRMTNASHTTHQSQVTRPPQQSQVPRSLPHQLEQSHSHPRQAPKPQRKQPQQQSPQPPQSQPLQPQPPQPQPPQPPQPQPPQPPQPQPPQPPQPQPPQPQPPQQPQQPPPPPLYAPPPPYPHVLHYGVPQQFMTAAHVAVAAAAAQAAVCPAPFVPHAPAEPDAARAADPRAATAQPPLPDDRQRRRCDAPAPAPLNASVGKRLADAETHPTEAADEHASVVERSARPETRSEHPRSPVLSGLATVSVEAGEEEEARKLGPKAAPTDLPDVPLVDSFQGRDEPSVGVALNAPNLFHAGAASNGKNMPAVVQPPEEAPSAEGVGLTQEEPQLSSVAEESCEQVVVGGTAVSFGHGPTASES